MKGDPKILVTTAEELCAQGIAYDSTTEFTYQGKQFKRVISLRKLFHEIITSFCQRETEKGKFCLLVEDETHFIIWQTDELLELTNREANSETETSSVQNGLGERIAIRSMGSSVRQANSLSSTNGSVMANKSRSDLNGDYRVSASSDFAASGLEPTFLFHCQQVLFDYVGPIAGSYILETLTQFPTITHRQLASQLATKIPNPQQAEEFWQRVLDPKTAPGQEVDPQPNRKASPDQSAPDQPSSKDKTSSEADEYKRSYRGVSY